MKLALLLLASVLGVQGATIYVTVGGNDTTGNGTIGNPYASCTKALTVAVAGDTINVGAGIYGERPIVTTSGTAGNPLTITGPYVASGVMRQATNWGFQLQQVQYVNLQFFQCSNNTVTVGAGHFDTGSGIWLHGCTNCIVRSNDCMLGGYVGISAYGLTHSNYVDSYNLDFIGNRCWSNAAVGMYLVLGQTNNNTSKVLYNEVWGMRIKTPQANWLADGDGIEIFGSHLLICSNYIHDLYWDDTIPGATGAHMDVFQTWYDYNYGGRGVRNSLIQGNLVFCPDINGTTFQCEPQAFSNNIVVNNIFASIKAFNIYGEANGIYNNTFVAIHNDRLYTNSLYNYGSSGFLYVTQGATNSNGDGSSLPNQGWCSNNIVVQNDLTGNNNGWNVSTNTAGIWVSNTMTFGNNAWYWTNGNVNLTANPGFYPWTNTLIVNQDPKFLGGLAAVCTAPFSSSNFALLAASPMINAGGPTAATNDIIGTVRPQGSAADIGAYEYVFPAAYPFGAQLSGNVSITGNATLKAP